MPTDPHRARRKHQSRRSRHELLAIRKEIVLTRIAIERAELIEVSRHTRERLRGFRWMRFLMPAGLGGLGKLSRSGVKLGGLLERYPLISSAASLALTGLTKTSLGRIVRPAVKWGGLGMLAWQGVKLWQQATNEGRANRAAQADVEATSTTSSATPDASSGVSTNDGGIPPLM